MQCINTPLLPCLYNLYFAGLLSNVLGVLDLIVIRKWLDKEHEEQVRNRGRSIKGTNFFVNLTRLDEFKFRLGRKNKHGSPILS